MIQRDKKIVLFANGELPAPENLLPQIRPQDVLIAVDGGLHHIQRLGLTPSIIIGDLDSVTEEEVQQYQTKGIEVRQYPTNKDETDLELALGVALELQISPIWVVAALGGRLDHTLGNIFLLTQSHLADVDVRLVDGECEVFLIRKNVSIVGKVGQRVSLIPLQGPAVGIRTQGLKFPLRDETLFPDRTRGISNHMASDSAEVSLQEGLLLCIHQINQFTERSGKND